MKRHILTKLIISFAFILLLIVFLFCFRSSSFVENYAQKIISPYFNFICYINNIFPFSIMETGAIFLIILGIYLLVKIIISLTKKKFVHALNFLTTIIMIVSILGTSYVGTAGFLYRRGQVDIPQYQERVTPEQIDNIANSYLDKYIDLIDKVTFDENGVFVIPYNTKELSKIITKEYNKLDSNYFLKSHSSAKGLLTSFFFRECQITGIFFAPTGEVNVNTLDTDLEKPFVMAHEFAHSKGVMREDEANLTAMYITLNSDDFYVQYSGYFWTFFSLIDLYYLTHTQSEYDAFIQKIPSIIFKQYSYNNDYWNKHDSLQRMMDKINDFYLKIFGNKKGTDSYIDTDVKVDTGEIDEDNRPIYEIISYSPFVKLYLYLFFN